MIYNVIMAGGKGERFWPLSRIGRPKQFLKLISDKMMLEETIDRVSSFIPNENVRIVTNQSMQEIIIENIPSLDKSNILTEPEGRNTCIAIGLAAIHLVKDDPEAVMVVLSADHVIKPPEKLVSIIKRGSEIAAEEDFLITIGITPTRPETGYGYVKMGELFSDAGGFSVHRVSGFTEKPKAAIASEYYYSRKYLWNSGMFIWSAKTLLSAIEKHQPEMHQLLTAYSKEIGSANEASARELLYKEVESISLDFALLEYADNVLTIKGDFIWDDVGGWLALERYKEKDMENNVIIGDALLLDSYETTAYNQEDGIIACLGISDIVVVRSGEITLVVHKTQADRIKDLLTKLEEDEKFKKYL